MNEQLLEKSLKNSDTGKIFYLESFIVAIWHMHSMANTDPTYVIYVMLEC